MPLVIGSVVVVVLVVAAVIYGISSRSNIRGRYDLTLLSYGGFTLTEETLKDNYNGEEVYIVIENNRITFYGFDSDFTVLYTREGDTLYCDDGYEVFTMTVKGNKVTMTYDDMYFEFTKQ